MGKINEINVAQVSFNQTAGYTPLRGVEAHFASPGEATKWTPTSKAEPDNLSKAIYDDAARQEQAKQLLSKYVLHNVEPEYKAFPTTSMGMIKNSQEFIGRARYEDVFLPLGLTPNMFIDLRAEFEKIVAVYVEMYKKAASSGNAAFVFFPVFPVSLPLKAYSDAKYEGTVPALIQIMNKMQIDLDRQYNPELHYGARLIIGLDDTQFESATRPVLNDDWLGESSYVQFFQQIVKIQLIVPASALLQIQPRTPVSKYRSSGSLLGEESSAEEVVAEEQVESPIMPVEDSNWETRSYLFYAVCYVIVFHLNLLDSQFPALDELPPIFCVQVQVFGRNVLFQGYSKHTKFENCEEL